MKQLVLAVTGGGSEAIGKLLRMGGASSYFLEGIVPYSKNSLDEFIGGEPEKYTSERTARQMAVAAFKRALQLGADPSEAVGVACTATLAKATTEREGREHLAFLAAQTRDSLTVLPVKLTNPLRTRVNEEDILSDLIVTWIQDHFQVEQLFPFLTSTECDYIVEHKRSSKDDYKVFPLLFGDTKKRDYTLTLNLGPSFLVTNSIIFPGSFNPFHRGHKQLVVEANKKFGEKVYLEISVNNVDKPSIDYMDIEDRMKQISDYTDQNRDFDDAFAGVILSNTALFYDKVWQYPTAKFLMGTDTINRISDRRYGSISELADLMASTGSRFVVANRAGVLPRIHDFLHRYVQNLDLPEEINLSSTQIRKEQENASGTSPSA